MSRREWRGLGDKPPYWDEESSFDYVDIVHNIGELVFDARDSRFGWLTPGGVLIGTGLFKHDLFARRVLGKTGAELEAQGWVKLSERGGTIWPKLAEGAELTEEQAGYLMEQT